MKWLERFKRPKNTVNVTVITPTEEELENSLAWSKKPLDRSALYDLGMVLRSAIEESAPEPDKMWRRDDRYKLILLREIAGQLARSQGAWTLNDQLKRLQTAETAIYGSPLPTFEVDK